MAFFKSVFEKVLGKVEPDDQGTSHEHQSGPRGYTEPEFSEAVTAEAKLKGLWRDYQHISQTGEAKLSKAALAKFLTLFKETFHSWQGFDDMADKPQQPPSPNKHAHGQHLHAARSMFGMPRASGCKAGHPQYVLEGLVLALHQVPADFGQVIRKQEASKEELHAAFELKLLEAFQILGCSQLNRQRLITLGCLPALGRIMKAVISRLNTMAAIIGVQDSLQHVGPQLWFLQSLLGNITAVIHTLAYRSLRHVNPHNPGLMHNYIAGHAQYAATTALEAGSRQEFEHMERIVRPFVDIQALLHEMLATLQLLRRRGAAVIGRWEHLALECLLSLVSASRHAQGYMQSKDPERNTLLMLMSGLGWPVAEAHHPAAAPAEDGLAVRRTMQGPGLQSIHDELKLQVHSLQVIGVSMKHNQSNLQAMQAAGGFVAITQLLQWTAFSFTLDASENRTSSRSSSAEKDAHRHASLAMSPATHQSGRTQHVQGSPSSQHSSGVHAAIVHHLNQATSHQTHSAMAGSGSNSHWPLSVELQELFAVLKSWLSLAGSRHGLPLWQELMKNVSQAVLDAFKPTVLLTPAAQEHTSRHADFLHSAAVAKLGEHSFMLQHHTLTFVTDLLSAEPVTLEHLRAQSMWELAYGHQFFFWGCLSQSGEQLQQPPQLLVSLQLDATANGASLTLTAEAQNESATEMPQGSAGAQQHSVLGPVQSHVLKVLRHHVAQATETAAGLPGLQSNDMECKRLLELLEDRTEDADIALEAATSLAHILQIAPTPTLKALDKHDAVTMMAYVVKRQQQFEGAQAVPVKRDDSHQSGNTSWHARCAVLALLASYLEASAHVQRQAVRKWNPVAALFGLLWEEQAQQLALSMIISLMKVAPLTEDDSLGKAALFTKYIEALPHALDSWKETGLGLVTKLLSGIQRVVQQNILVHQNLFRSAECYVQLLNLLNIDYPPEAGTQLCEKVLATLMALLAGNEASRQQLQQGVGYDTLLSIVLRCSGPHGPSGGILMQLLHLVLEQAYHKDKVAQIANTDAIPLYISCLMEADHELQLRGLTVWTRLVQGNMANLSASDRAGVNGILISWFAADKTSSDCRVKIAELLQVTGAYSISGRDLRSVLGLLKRDPHTGANPPYAPLLLRMLCTMAQHEGPSAFFDFANGSAGIMRTTPLQLPTSKGYTFATWLRVEEGLQQQQESGGRALYAMLIKGSDTKGSDTKGIIAALAGYRVVVRCMQPKLSEVTLPFLFQPSRWYHVVITHTTGSALSSSMVRLFVDGNLEASTRFKYVKVSEPVNACSFAAGVSSAESGLTMPIGAFQGQAGCLYLFNDVLNPGQVAALHALGPDYQSIFAPTDSNPLLDQTPGAASLLIHGKEALGPRLMLSYNAQAAAGRMLYNTIDMEGTIDTDRDTAAVLENTQLCCTCQLRDLLHCLGGIGVLLPLVTQFDIGTEQHSPAVADESSLVRVVELMAAVLEDSPSNRLTMLQTSGMAILGYLMQHRSPSHLNAALLHTLEKLLHAVTPSEPLTKQLLQQLLLNLRLWSSASPAGQLHLHTLILKLTKDEPALIRHLLPVPSILATIRAHYWETPGPDALKQAYAGDLSPQKLHTLRSGLLEVVKVIMKASAAQDNIAEDVQALVSFIGDCQDTELLQDALELICSLLQRHEPTQQPMLAVLEQLGGVQLFMSLVQREQQSLKILGLRILAAFLPLASHHTPPLSPRSTGGSEYVSALSMGDVGLWPALNDALLMFPLTKGLRLALLNLLCSQQGMAPARAEGPPLITAAPVMGIMLGLLRGCDAAEERISTLQALKRLIVEGPPENLALITNTNGWQEWLLELLLDGSPCLTAAAAPGQSRRVSSEGVARADSNTHTAWEWAGQETQALRAMLRALHGYCAQYKSRGWTALEQTACHLRVHASRGVVDGYGLLHELLADVMEDLVDQVARHNQHDSLGSPGRGSGADSWTVISSAASEICRENGQALLGLSLELLSGSLIAPSNQDLQPSSAAKQWAEAPGTQDISPQAWAAVGLSVNDQAPVLHMEQQHWRLPDACWRLMYNVQKTNGSSSSPSPSQRPSLSRRLTPDTNALRVRINSASSAGDEGSTGALTRKLDDGVVRLLLRMLLLYIQQAPVHRANHSVQQALALLPMLLGPSLDSLNRCRLQMLLAALNLLHERLKAQEGSTRRRQAAAGAVTKLIEKFGGSLVDQGASGQTGMPPSAQQGNWQQGMVQQHNVVEAVRTECRCMQHEASRQTSAMQLLESIADKRRMEERSLEHDFWESAREALGNVCAGERSKRAAARVAHDEQQQAVSRQWRRLQRSLTCDRGIWADTTTPQHYHWKLDKSEDNVRRRMKLKRNYHFVQYDDPDRGKPATPTQSAAKVPDRLLSGMLRMRSVVPDDDDLDSTDVSPARALSPVHSPGPSSPRGPTRQASVETLEMPTALSSNTLPDDDREAMAAQSQQEQGQVLLTVQCELVTPKHVVPGTLKILQGLLHFTGDPAPEDTTGVGTDASTAQPRESRTHKSWPIPLIAELHHARYLLQPRALELFLSNRSSALLSFATPKAMRDVVNCIHNITSRIVIMDRKRKLETAARLQLRWQRWEVTNYDYLMQLNTLAGRTFNDLNQYPVFPWVLADYTSHTLDLNAPETYRDLSKPVGALNEKRCQEFQARYESLRGDPEIPPFHYGSHYSSAGMVLFYLIRMEPFTGMNRQLQGGRFDHADRLFTNVPATWDNCLHSSSDVKELTPEFYHQSEFLLNSNSFNLGTQQTGATVGDVGLPPWAHGSTDEFIRLQREALESDYVSEHLNEWVDLIFGFKQRGKEAEAACNVFYHLTYEGAVDLDRIEDPTQLKAVEEQIRNFGQTPSQLFKRRHIRRNAPPSPSARPFLNQPSAVQLVTVGQPNAKRPNIGIACLEVTEGRVVLINADRAVSCHRWVSSRAEAGAFTFSSALPEIAYGVEAESAPPRMLGTPFAADLESRHCFAVLPGASTVVSCGYWDNTIRCYTTHDGKLLQSLKQHKDIVTCVAAGADCRTIVSGSRDTTLVIWDAAPPPGKAKQKGIVPLVLRDRPRHVLYGHSDAVVCLAVCTELDLVVSASSDGSLLFHTLLEGRYMRNLNLPGNAPPQLLVIAPGPGVLLAHSWQSLAIHAYTVNGRHLATSEGTERLSALAVSADGRFLLSGGAKGVITLQWIHSLQVVHRFDENQGPITALAATPEDCILAGCHNGCMLVFAPRTMNIQTKFNLGEAPWNVST